MAKGLGVLVAGAVRAGVCERHGHRWFPNLGQSEFVPLTDLCLRCKDQRHTLPWGTCLDGTHTLARHYREDLSVQPVGDCPGPQ